MFGAWTVCLTVCPMADESNPLQFAQQQRIQIFATELVFSWGLFAHKS